MNKDIFMKYVYQYIHLLSFYLNHKECDIKSIDKETLSFYIKLSKFHSLTSLLYKAIKELHIEIDKEQEKKLEEYYLSNLRKVVLFEKEREVLYKYLNDNHIDYLPLKGIVIGQYYPDPSTREFADNDILFDKTYSKLVKDFFKSRGYKVEAYKNGCHDVYQKEPFFNFEMHRLLFALREDGRNFYDYFDNYLRGKPIKEGYEHYLSDEDFYIYFTAHTYKHYSECGCGIRTLIDYYLFLEKTNLDFAYINKELEKLNLLDFSSEIIELVKHLFNDEPLDEKQEKMFSYFASSGVRGTTEHRVDSGVGEHGRFGYIISRLFPPINFYKVAYPCAYKHKVLIPIAWCKRTFRAIFKNHKKTKEELKAIKKTKKDKKQ